MLKPTEILKMMQMPEYQHIQWIHLKTPKTSESFLNQLAVGHSVLNKKISVPTQRLRTFKL